jgi:glucose/arabinose dehydrogenase
MRRRDLLKALGLAAIGAGIGYLYTRLIPEGDGPIQEPGATPSLEVVDLATDLVAPWSILPLEDGRILVTERPGRLLVVERGRKRRLAEIPVARVGEAGLLGLAKHPDFPGEPYLYLYRTISRSGRLENQVFRLRVEADTLAVKGQEAVLDGIPGAAIHDGGRIRFGPDGRLYITTGDAAKEELAQDLESLAGKILRIEADGTIPSDNPFPGSAIYSYGHRNPQGLDWHPTSKILVASEHGPIGHDEINLIVKGGNYGWPLVTGAREEKPGMINPLIDFAQTTIAPSGASFTRQGDFLVACLRGERLVRVRFREGMEVVAVEHLLHRRLGRLRDVVVEQEGTLLMVTSNRDGRGRPREGDDRLVRVTGP